MLLYLTSLKLLSSLGIILGIESGSNLSHKTRNVATRTNREKRLIMNIMCYKIIMCLAETS